MGRVWTKEKISLKLIDLYNNEKINASYVRKNYSSLYSACHNHFKTYKNAVEYAGIDYDDLKFKSSAKYKLIKEAEELKSSENLKMSVLNGEKKHLKAQINRYFNNINNFLDFMGVSYEEYNDSGIERWDKESVLKELDKIYQDIKLSPLEFQKLHGSLYTACRNYFGSFKNALDKININYEDIKIQKTWSKEKIQNKLLYLKDKEKVTSRYVMENYCDLHHACRNHFGSYENALASVGIDLKEESKKEFDKSVERSRIWSKDKVKKELIRLYEEEILVDSYVRMNHKDLHHACLNYFGSYRDAIKEAGLEYDEISSDAFSLFGFEFELLLREIYDLFNIKYERSTLNGLRPDFRLDNNVWVDAKLSQWTVTINDTIDKYKDHCDKLIIVFLRGYSEREIVDDKVEIVSIDTYLKELGIDEDHKVFNWIEELREKVN